MDKQFDINQFNMKQVESAKEMVRKRFPELVERYLTDANTYIERINEGLDSDNLEMIVKSAHSLKSSSASLGIVGAFEVARELEGIAKEPEENDINDMPDLAKMLREALDIAEPKLRALLEDAA